MENETMYLIFLTFTVTVAILTVILKRRQYRNHLAKVDSFISELDQQRDDFIRDCKENGLDIPEWLNDNN
tara:strand:- start:1095 stop:1304 length:210 start_codon:yes stop_codon:yes gene_type:complete